MCLSHAVIPLLKGKQGCLCMTLQQMQYVQLESTTQGSLQVSRTHLSANRMSALSSRVFGVSIMSISTVVELEGQGLSAKVTAVYLTVAHPALLFLEAN